MAASAGPGWRLFSGAGSVCLLLLARRCYSTIRFAPAGPLVALVFPQRAILSYFVAYALVVVKRYPSIRTACVRSTTQLPQSMTFDLSTLPPAVGSGPAGTFRFH